MNLRDNWRIVLLVLFTLASAVVLLAPLAVQGTAVGNGLQYGLQLSGGTQIKAPLVGTTAENVNFSQSQLQDQPALRRSLATDLGVEPNDIGLRPQAGAVEVYSKNVTHGQFVDALNNNGFDVAASDVRDGVTTQTAQEVAQTLSHKINQAGLTGGSARVATAGSTHLVVVEVPNANRSQVVNMIKDRGVVQLVAHYPATGGNATGYNETVLVTNEDFAKVSGAEQPNPQNGQPEPHVTVTLKQEAAANYADQLERLGFTSGAGTGPNACPTQEAMQHPDTAEGYCLYTRLNGKVVAAHYMSADLGRSMENGDFAKRPTFVMTARNMSEARQLALSLDAGALTTSPDIQNGTVYSLQASQGQQYKFASLIAGLIAWIAVSGVVFFRYGSARVAVPMLLTAAAEVFLLLGFSAAVGLALNLSHIAGFIAVIGTGVDDLIIIADEILQEGTVATGRVFQNRFRKAFWVIGGAAATTIVAMSPLMALSLGDLTGFAIVTIVGVLLGVLVTRPAYGDILRNLMLDEGDS